MRILLFLSILFLGLACGRGVWNEREQKPDVVNCGDKGTPCEKKEEPVNPCDPIPVNDPPVIVSQTQYQRQTSDNTNTNDNDNSNVVTITINHTVYECVKQDPYKPRPTVKPKKPCGPNQGKCVDEYFVEPDRKFLEMVSSNGHAYDCVSM